MGIFCQYSATIKFSLFVLSGMDALKTIYQNILSQHLIINNFSNNIQKQSEKLVVAALQFHQKVASSFLPTAIKFHYIFNLRDLSNIFQGILFSTPECVKVPIDFVCLWLHEASRVYGDKMVDEKDISTLRDYQLSVAKGNFEVKYDILYMWICLNQLEFTCLGENTFVNSLVPFLYISEGSRGGGVEPPATYLLPLCQRHRRSQVLASEFLGVSQ